MSLAQTAQFSEFLGNQLIKVSLWLWNVMAVVGLSTLVFLFTSVTSSGGWQIQLISRSEKEPVSPSVQAQSQQNGGWVTVPIVTP